jgi:hypothetical protein
MLIVRGAVMMRHLMRRAIRHGEVVHRACVEPCRLGGHHAKPESDDRGGQSMEEGSRSHFEGEDNVL